jgi:hypothetical protein
MKTVYIIAPYTKGDQARNVRDSMILYENLVFQDYAPYNPLLSHFQEIYSPQPYERWMFLDEEWLRRCDIVVRIEGESEGGDREELLAKELGKPFYVFSVEEVMNGALFGMRD